MILECLVSQLEQRFQHEKRAQVCLWFDEKQEFARLLPALQAHLAGMPRPPFVLLAYDEEKLRGQIWLKHRVHTLAAQSPPSDRDGLRFVLYLPMSEDRLDHPDGDGRPRLDFLEEYRTAGVIWRLGGKRPTLFSLLRQADVPLPDNPAEQRRLYDGGRDSLLAKYVAKFADRPPVFWARSLTAESAQLLLIGDVEQTILDLAMEPDEEWAKLQESALDREFLDMVRERYGYDQPVRAPAEWILDLVATLALTETFLGYREPADFPFADRLPPLALRSQHSHLLQRWLRDSEYRQAWDRWIAAVETEIDLTSWARGRPGISFGFPHLVRLRWGQVISDFEKAAPRKSAVEEYFKIYGELLAREAEFAKASPAPVGAWDLLRDLGAFVRVCAEAERKLEWAITTEALAGKYVENAGAIEGRHLDLRQRADEQTLPSVAKAADRAYADYATALNDSFFKRLAESGRLEIPGIPDVTPHLERAIWQASGRRAVVIVDALRYDCALAIKELLRGHAVEVEPLLAVLPTVTAIGMTALLPLAGATIAVDLKDNSIHPLVNGKDTFVRDNRIALLRAFGADCREISEVEAAPEAPDGLGELLVVFGHDDVDHIGHGNAGALTRHVQPEIDRLGRLIRNLHRWGYPRVHVVTDHGFILLDEARLPSEVPFPKEWRLVLKERFALVSAEADIPLARFPFAWDARYFVAVPPGLAFFKCEKSFSHGGASLQELIIPHLVSRGHAAKAKRIGVEVVLPALELMQTAVKVVLSPVSTATETGTQLGLFAEMGRNLSLDVRRKDADGELRSVLAGKPKEVRLDGKNREQVVKLFFHSAASFAKGELLELDIRDVETLEQFPAGGITLTVGRDM
jgi:hypothetical protein